MAELSQDLIRERAYFLWQQDGQPAGVNDWHYWLLAEQQIRTELSPEAVAPSPASKPAPRRKAATTDDKAAVARKAVKATADDSAVTPKKAPAKRRAPAKPGKA